MHRHTAQIAGQIIGQMGGLQVIGLDVNCQEVICRSEPGHRGDITDAAVRPVPVVVMQPARQGIGSFG